MIPSNDNQHQNSHDEDACLDTLTRRALISAWKKLKPAYRPTRPRELIELILINYNWPTPAFYPPAHIRFDLERVADANLKRFVEAARALRGSIPRSDTEFVLLTLLDARIPSGEAGEAISDRLTQLETWLDDLSGGFGLLPRPVTARPARVAEPYIRDLVRAVFWHILHVEGRGTSASFEGSPPRPASRAGIIAQATVQALGHSTDGIKRHIEAVQCDPSWKKPSFRGWQTLPRAAP